MTAIELPPLRDPVRTIGSRTFDFSRQIAVMAVINRTPDSFYDSGKTFALDRAIEACLTAAAEGADLVDIGGVKFGPGPEVPAKEELHRVIPVIEAVAAESDVVISVDTFRPDVAAAAIAAGASVVNDTTGIFYPELADVVAASEASLVITHSLATPRTWFPRPAYNISLLNDSRRGHGCRRPRSSTIRAPGATQSTAGFGAPGGGTSKPCRTDR